MRGITPVISIILLLIITIAVVGLAYTFILGFFSSATSKTALVSAIATCSSGTTNIIVTNAGNDQIAIGDFVIVRKSCTQKSGSTVVCPSGQPTWATGSGSTWPLQPGRSGSLVEQGAICGANNVCNYDVAVGSGVYPSRSDC